MRQTRSGVQGPTTMAKKYKIAKIRNTKLLERKAINNTQEETQSKFIRRKGQNIKYIKRKLLK